MLPRTCSFSNLVANFDCCVSRFAEFLVATATASETESIFDCLNNQQDGKKRLSIGYSQYAHFKDTISFSESQEIHRLAIDVIVVPPSLQNSFWGLNETYILKYCWQSNHKHTIRGWFIAPIYGEHRDGLQIGFTRLVGIQSSQNFPILGDGFAKEVRRRAFWHRGHQQGASGSAWKMSGIAKLS